MHTLSWLVSNGTNTVSTGRDAVLTWRKWGGGVRGGGGGGINFFLTYNDSSIGKAVDSQTGAGLAVDLWVSRTEASFSVKFCFF